MADPYRRPPRVGRVAWGTEERSGTEEIADKGDMVEKVGMAGRVEMASMGEMHYTHSHLQSWFHCSSRLSRYLSLLGRRNPCHPALFSPFEPGLHNVKPFSLLMHKCQLCNY